MKIKEYQLNFLASFNEDLQQTVYYISHILKNPEAANRLVNNIEKAIYDRLNNPLAYQPYRPEIKLKIPTIGYMSVTILFSISLEII